jgi:2-polyprenyl-3-methyl-5-hydroxy-6-metoxy-1,4-benzoquinol methylase
MINKEENRKILLRAYDALAPFSDKSRSEFECNLFHFSFLVEHIPLGSTIYDAGCGVGVLGVALAIRGYKVFGGDKFVFKPDNDFYLKNSEPLKDIWKKYSVEVSDIDLLVEEIKGQYDAVISIATIEHQKDPKRFLTKLLKAVKPSGYVYLATPNVTHLLNRVRFFCGRSSSSEIENFFSTGELFVGHWREYTLDELKYMFNKVGLKIIEAKNIQHAINFKIKNFRKFHKYFFALLSYLVPGSGNANIILGKNVK